jgi:hypothetical protein
MDSSLIVRLVTTHLRPFERSACCLQLFGSAGAVAAEAAALSGFGLDLYSGERVLASLGVVAPQGRIAAAFTNHRTIVGGAGIAIAVRHDEILDLSVTDDVLELRTPAGTRDLGALHVACDCVAGFYRALLAADPHARVEAPSPTFAPGVSDPTGAQGAIGQLWGNDPAAAEMLGELARRARRGDLDEGAAQDLVGRVVLSHRARCCGPAAFGARFLSPLTGVDFGELVLAVLGTPASRHKPARGGDRLEFVVDGTMVGVAFREVSGGTSYVLHCGPDRLEAHDGGLAHRLHRRLVEGAHAWLERHCITRAWMAC